MTQSVNMQTPNVGPQSPTTIPFRRSTVERVEILPSESSVTWGTNTLPIERTIEGNGFVYAVKLHLTAPASGNAATVAVTEDAPFAAYSRIVYRDNNGETVNVSGFGLYLANLINKNYANNPLTSASTYTMSTGAAATSGSIDFWLSVPVGINRRDLTGILGNQNRSQRFALRTDLAGNGAVYTTTPTTVPAVTIAKYYEEYSVPMATSANGTPQSILPPTYGTLHFLTESTDPSAPLGGSTVTHNPSRIGNVIRWQALTLRANGSRATAAGAMPTSIRLKVGDDTLFNEDANYRRQLMQERFGFDLPNGVLVYDNIHDFGNSAGMEIGDDYWHTEALNTMQYQVAYPSGFGSTANSLTILTDDLIYANPSVSQVG